MTPTAPMAYLLGRLRDSIADPALFDDPTVTRFLSDGYIAACERSRCLRAWVSQPLTANFQEYALPSDWVETMGVYMNGEPMDELSTRIAPRADAGNFYYSYGGVIGLVTTPTVSGGSYILHYARRPAALGAAGTPERQFGPEWYWLLRAYAAWHIYRLGYGEEYVGEANRQRVLFDTGVAMLERWSMSQDAAAVNSTPINHVLNVPSVVNTFA